jgi:hypothetical protein
MNHFSKIILFLAITLLLILHYKHPYLLYYWSVMAGSVLFLNSRQKYRALDKHRIYNALFCSYLAFVTIVRIGEMIFPLLPKNWKQVINIGEHGFFALVICLKIMVYLNLFTKIDFQKKCFASVFFLNVIGVCNEFFQNKIQHFSLLNLSAESQKDLLINFLGSVLFYFLVKNTKITPQPAINIVL